jgi:D-serine deaminase-like pyridoxal phosphate-dependent protein
LACFEDEARAKTKNETTTHARHHQPAPSMRAPRAIRDALARLHQHRNINNTNLPAMALALPPVGSGGGRHFNRPRSAAAAATATTALADLPPAHRGQRLGHVDTPALLVDLDAVERNALRLRAELEAINSTAVKVRPHFKAHKCPPLAALTLRALGPALAPGMCAQKLGEAEAMVWSDEGIQDVCITNQVAPSPGKMRRLAALARHASRPCVSVVVDSAVGLRALADEVKRQEAEASSASSSSAAPPPHPLGVLVEIDAGQGRCGVDSPVEAADLAALVAELASQQPKLLEFRGIQAYHGGIQHVRRAVERRDAAMRAAERAAEAVAAVEARGLNVAVVTGGGSGTCLFDATSGIYTEVQPGSLFLGDADYARNEPSSALLLSSSGEAPSSDQAAWVATTVMSRSEKRSVAVVDAGLKAVALDSGPPRVFLNGAGEAGVEFKNGGDEHGVLLFPHSGTVPPGASPPIPSVGEVLRLMPGHCDPQWNLYDWVVAYRGGAGGGGGDWRLPVEAVWRVSARSPGT